MHKKVKSSEEFVVIEDTKRKNTKTKKIKEPVTKLKKKKRSKKEDKEFVDLGEDLTGSGGNFVILGEKRSRKSIFLGPIRFLFSSVLIICFVVLTFAVLSFKMIPEKINGANFQIKQYYFISRNFVPNVNELKPGDIIIKSIDTVKWLPVVFKYNKYTYKSRNGVFLFVEDEQGHERELKSTELDYIIRE